MGMKDQTILVTGAAGFIGSSLTDYLLRQGARVVGVDNFCDFYDESLKRDHISGAMGDANFSLVEVDIRDREGVLDIFRSYEPDVVIHLAAMAGVRPSIENPSYYTSVNLCGTVNLLDGAVGVGCEKFIFASSSSVYGNNEKVPFAESDVVDHPISPYAATKKSGELICHSYAHLHPLSVACLRFFTVFGPRQRPDLAIGKFLRLIGRGEEITMFGDGSSSRDYTYIDDIVGGIVGAMDYVSGYEIFNLGGSSPVSLREMIDAIELTVGKKAKIRELPMQAGDVNRTWADVSYSASCFGYAPRTSLLDGMAKQWAWMNR